MRLIAPAKINLSLAVTGRRPDGYHELESLMVKVSLADEIYLEPRPNGGSSRFTEIINQTGRPLPSDFIGPGNLIFKALNACRPQARRGVGFNIRLIKRIPCGGGLGGGSSDGAAILAWGPDFFGASLNQTELTRLAARLGADLPFFLWPEQTAWIQGIGEKVGPGPKLDHLRFLLINPGSGLSTKEVFQNLSLTVPPVPIKISNLPAAAAGQSCSCFSPPGPSSQIEPGAEAAANGPAVPIGEPIWAWPDLGRNDLLAAAAGLDNQVKRIARCLEELMPGRPGLSAGRPLNGGPVAWGLSGSGPTFWVMAEERAILRTIAGRLQGQNENWRFYQVSAWP